MKKISFLTILIFVIFSISKADMQKYCVTPPFITASVTPNVLIILDNSNSMDEDFYGNAAASFSSASKMVVAKKALIDIIQELKDKLRIGLMTYRIQGVQTKHIHNSPYFTSYEPKSYCPDPPPECETYCKTGDLSAKAICSTDCLTKNILFDVDYFDEIITNYPIGSEERNRYCHLVYPKTQRTVNPKDTAHYIYYKQALPMYSSGNLQTAFCYSNSYNPDEGSPYDYYVCYKTKTGTSDNYVGYSSYWFGSKFVPTDTDFALGYYDFGRRLSWWHIGRTWFSNSSPGNGYLHVEVDDLINDSDNTTTTYDALLQKLDPKENDESGYMSCSKSNKNKCPYIISAGLTPTAGTLQSAIDYFQGRNSPIQYRCQRNFIVYVTDGLPSVDEDGNTDTADNLMPSVLSKLDTLRNLVKNINGTDYNFDIKTYILGVGLTDDAKAKLDDMAVHGGTDVNGHAFYADNPQQLNDALSTIFVDILKKTASGTSVSVLSEKATKGAIVHQAVFYPTKVFEDYSVDWIGYLYSYWFLNTKLAQNIREDTNQNKFLDILDDNILFFDIDPITGNLKINAYTSKLDGNKKDPVNPPLNTLDDIKPIWEAGKLLASRDPSDRVIGGVSTSDTIEDFIPSNDDDFKENFGSSDFPSCLLDEDGDPDYKKLIRYIRGEDIEGCRTRTIDSNGNVWKLGDIVYSTPRIADYDGYAVVYTGSNDGMLHAFKIGKVSKTGLSINQTAKLEGTELGKELWAFIPKNVMPYLKYLANPDYCHIYMVDLSPYIVDVDSDGDGTNDKKILIGGMRLGGGCGCSGSHCINPPTDTCPRVCSNDDDVSCSTDDDCSGGGKCIIDPDSDCIGRSSYFALDITNPTSPQFLWEFTDEKLGFSYSGPAIIKRKNGGNWNYFVMFASGPTNYEGYSDQPLNLFILDLLTGSLEHTYEFSSLNNSFGGRLFTEGLDVNEDGETDFVFLGYTNKTGNATAHGGLIKIWTGSNDPSSWEFDNTYYNLSTNPITAKVNFMKCFDKWFIYFGTGKYFYKTDDDQNLNAIYGIPFTCDENNNCSTGSVNAAHSTDEEVACEDIGKFQANKGGWMIQLNGEESNYLKERNISDPSVSDFNVVFFATTSPTGDVCGFGGKTRAWALNCATGESVSSQRCQGYSVRPNVVFKYLLQLSGGDIKQYGKTNFSTVGGRATEQSPGLPSEEGGIPITPPSVSEGKIILWIER